MEWRGLANSTLYISFLQVSKFFNSFVWIEGKVRTRTTHIHNKRCTNGLQIFLFWVQKSRKKRAMKDAKECGRRVKEDEIERLWIHQFAIMFLVFYPFVTICLLLWWNQITFWKAVNWTSYSLCIYLMACLLCRMSYVLSPMTYVL